MSDDEGVFTGHIEADSASETDSALGEDQSTYTASLRSSLLQSVSENGRGYHKYRDGQYIVPEDKTEQDRLDMQHEMFIRTFGGKIHLAPVREAYEVLDLGTGTGIWAVDFADANPQANVLGIDLSPIQPTYAPPNCKWEVEDFENEWTFKQKFDFVHGRMLLTSVADFPRLMRQTYDALQPGGWFELSDLYMPVLSDDGTIKDTSLQAWNDQFLVACKRFGRNPSLAAKYKDFMLEAGFIDVQETMFKWPINTWAKDKALKEIGRWNYINMMEGMEGFTVRLFTKALGQTFEEVQVLLAGMRKDCADRSIHSYWPMCVSFAQ